MTMKTDATFEGKLTCCLENEIFTRAFESLKIGTLMGSFYPKQEIYEHNTYSGVMVTKNDTKFEEKLTCRFKTEMRNLTNFYPSTRKSQKLAL